MPGGVVAYDDRWDSCVAGILGPVPLTVLLDAGVDINWVSMTNMALRVIFRRRQDSAELMSFHLALQRAPQ